jgi:hypothetical protein
MGHLKSVCVDLILHDLNYSINAADHDYALRCVYTWPPEQSKVTIFPF